MPLTTPGIAELRELHATVRLAVAYAPAHIKEALLASAQRSADGVERALCPSLDKNQEHG